VTTETDTIILGGDMARQTAQAKMLREARDELAKRAADEKCRRLMVKLGLMNERRAKEIAAGSPFTSEDMADMLGVKVATLRQWLATPKETPGGHLVGRNMTKTARRLLDILLERVLV
jgi:hypothetical protein